MMLRKLLFSSLLLLFAGAAAGQIWIEDFSTQANGTDQDPPMWTTTANDCDDPGLNNGNFWGVSNGRFLVNDVEGFNCVGPGGDNQNIFLTEVIDISAYACVEVTVGLDVNDPFEFECDFPAGPVDDPVGSYNSHDQMVVEYSLDGGPWTVFPTDGYICGATPSTSANLPATANSGQLEGNNLQIRIKAGNKANGEEYFFDNIIVTDATVPLNLIQLAPLCTSDPPVPLLNNQNGIDGTWSGPGLVGNNFAPAVADAGTSTLTFTPLPGECANPGTIDVQVGGEDLNPPAQSIDICFTLIPPTLISENIGAVESEITGGDPGLTVNWYSDAGATNPITPFNILSLGLPTVIYASVTDGACESGTVPVDVTYNNPPNANDLTITFCDAGGATTLDLSEYADDVAGNGMATVEWYLDPAATNPVPNPNAFTTGPTTLYAVVLGSNGCDSPPATVTVVNDPVDPADVTIALTPGASCGPSGPITVTFTLPLGVYDVTMEYGNPMSGFQTVSFSNISNGSTEVFPSITESTTFRLLSLDDGDCLTNFSPAISATIIVQTVDDLPPILDVSSCGSYTLPNESGGVPIQAYYTGSGGSGGSFAPGDVITNNITLFAVTGNVPSCFDEEQFDITIFPPPDLDASGPAILCDGDAIDLTTLVFDINASGLTITYHDASPPTPANQLPSPVVSPTTTTTYFAIADGGPGCTDQVSVEVIVNPIPVANPAGPLTVCAGPAGTATFNLTTLEPTITGGAVANVNWFQDAGLTSPISNPGNYVSGTTTVYATITQNSCASGPEPVELIATPAPPANSPTPPDAQCVDGGTGVASYDLTTFNNQINNQPGATVTWYLDPGGANPVADPTNFTTGANTTVFAIVSAGGCDAPAVSLPLEVIPAPAANTPNIPAQCETGPGIALFNLTDYDNQVNGGTGDPVTWYLDAAGNNPIPDPTAFPSGSQTVFAAVTANGCESGTVSVTLNVLNAPVANATTLQACETLNGMAEFDLTSADLAVNNGTGLLVTWYIDPAGSIPIATPANFMAANNSTVYATVNNGTCESATVPVTLEVLDAPEAFNTSANACDSGGGLANFDLTALDNQINGGSGLPVSWYADPAATTPINDPANFTTGSATVYATVSNGVCNSVVISVNLVVIPGPTANPTSLDACEENGGQATFNLTLANLAVNGGNGLPVNWYADPAGALPIADPTNLFTGSSTVYATVNTPACESGTVPVTLTVVPTPAANPANLVSCPETGNEATFNLTDANNSVNNEPGVAINWYFDPAGLNLIPTPLSFTTATTTVYATAGDGACTSAPAPVTLTVFDPPVISGFDQLATIDCAGDSTAAIAPLVTGGAGSFNYNWNIDAFDGLDVLTGLPAGLYALTVTDLNNCVDSASVSVTEPMPLTLSCTPTSPVSAPGADDGQAEITFGGGVEPYTLSWAGPVTGSATPANPGALTLDNLPAGAYTTTLTDANGCTIECSFGISAPDCQLSIFFIFQDIFCFGANDGSIEIVEDNGMPPYTYDWNIDAFDGSDSLTNLAPGFYAVTVTDAAGCVDTNSVTLLEAPALLLNCTTISGLTGPNTDDGVAQVAVDGGFSPYRLIWSGPVTDSTLVLTADTVAITDLPAGNYTVVLTDNTGFCSDTCDFAVPPAVCDISTDLALTDPDCAGGQNGSAELTPTGGAAPYDYDWNVDSLDGNFLADSLSSGGYSVTVTGALGCADTVDFTLTAPSDLLLTCAQISQPSTTGAADGQGAATLSGGTPPYTLNWAGPVNGTVDAGIDTTLTLGMLPAGGYDLLLTDGNGCTAPCNFTINDPGCNLTLAASWIDPTCGDSTDGSIDLTPNGGLPPYTFDWSIDSLDGQQNVTGLSAGVYEVVVTDDAGCLFSTSITLNAPPALTLSCAENAPVSAAGAADGQALIITGGGTAPFALSWTGPVTGDSILAAADSLFLNDLPEGVYNLQLTDDSGCTTNCSFTINTQNCDLVLDLTGADPSCFGAADGNITLTVSNATPIVQYDWNIDSLDGIQNPDDLSAGLYTVLVTDGAGCTALDSITLNDPPELGLACSQNSPASAPGANDGSASITISGGDNPYSLFWSGPVSGGINNLNATSPSLNNLPAGDYTVTLTDANGCVQNCSFTITDFVCQMTVDLAGADITCAGAGDGSIDLTVNDGAAPFTFDWNDDTLDGTEDPNNLEPGAYAVTVTDDNGCTAADSVTLNTTFDSPTINVSDEPTVCEGSCAPFALIFTGAPPFILRYRVNVNGASTDFSVQINNLTNTLSICPDDFGNGVNDLTVDFLELEDDNCIVPLAISESIAVLPPTTGVLDTTLCPGESLVINGVVFDETTPTGDVTLTNNAGCDSLLSVAVDFFPAATGDFQTTLCPGDSIFVNGTIYNENNTIGTEILTGAAANGCDSILNVTVDILPTPNGDFQTTLCPGESITVNGTVYDENNITGTEILTAAAANGCDSILNVTVDILPTPTGDFLATLCPGESITVNGTVYDENNISGTEILTAAAANGCDSILNVTVDILPTPNGDFLATLCPGESITVNGTVYDENNITGTEILTAAAANGCDSILNVTVDILPTPTGDFLATLCPGESITVNGTVYDENNISGTEILTAAAANGCDSILNVTVDILPTPNGDFLATLCPGESITVNGTVYDENNITGTEILTAAAANGCDSTLNVNIEFAEPPTGTLSPTLCPGGNLVINGVLYDAGNPSGTEILTGAAANGCDSVLQVNLSFFEPATGALAATLCSGENLLVNGTIYDENNPSGTEILIGAAANGCDSIVTVSLDFLEAPAGLLQSDLCPGESLTFGGQVFDENTPSGAVLFPGGGANGCDSTLVVELNFVEAAFGSLETTLCAGESLQIGSVVFDENNPSGAVTLPDASFNNCDSIVMVDLSFLPVATGTLDTTLCAGETLTLGDQTFSADNPSGEAVLTGGAANGCDSILSVNLNFQPAVTAALSGANAICQGDTALLSVELTGGDLYDLIIQSSTGPEIALNGVANGISIPVNPAATTTYTLQSASTGGVDCPSLLGDPVTVSVSNVAVEAVLESDFNGFGVSCSDNTDGAVRAIVSQGAPPITTSWSTGDTGAVVNGLAAGTYAVFVRDAAGCTTADSVTVTAPPPIELAVSSRPPSCFGEQNGLITIEGITDGTAPYEISTDGLFFNAVNELPRQLINQAPGEYTLVVQDVNDCSAETTIEVGTPSEPSLNLGMDETIQLGDSVLLEGLTNLTVDRAVWTPDTFLLNPASVATIAYPDATTTYRLTVSDSTGCTATDLITVIVVNERPVYIPEAFSPNGDGVNDRFMVFGGVGIEEVEDFQVFDRWGNQLFQDGGFLPNDPLRGWDGNLAGQPMNAGVYVYHVVIRFADGKSESFQGDVLLAR